MPVRLARLMSAALLSAGLSTVVFAAASSSLTWRGDVVTGNGVMKGMTKAWQSAGHGNVELQPFNTASGLDAVASGAADIGGSARPSSGSSVDAGLTFTPVAWDALVLVTSPSNPVSNLTLQQVHDIYYGKITNWNQVGGNSEPIDVFAVASPGDGVEWSLRKLLFGRGSQPVAAPRLYVNTTQLEASVALDTRGFGVTTLSEVAGNSKIKMIHIDGVAPSISSVASGSYPLFSELYLVTNPSSPNAASAKEFVDFTQSAKGETVLRSHSLLPYAEGSALVAMDASRRSRILAAVGAHASAEPIAAAPSAARLVTPAAAIAAAKEPSKPSLADVTGSVVAVPQRSSLVGVTGDALTVASPASAGAFGKVTADVYVTYAKTTKHGKDKVASVEKIEAPKPAAAVAVRKSEAKKDKIASVSSNRAVHTYRVGSGETLYSIARKHGVEVAQSRQWNHLKDNTVRTGQVLRIQAQ